VFEIAAPIQIPAKCEIRNFKKVMYPASYDVLQEHGVVLSWKCHELLYPLDLKGGSLVDRVECLLQDPLGELRN
jgi:hypothetical protein